MAPLCVSRDGWVTQMLAALPHPELPALYNVGPIGVPQPFRTMHGEWGPPVGKISDIDWELYSMALICCDVLLTIVWHFIAARTLVYMRVKWLSPTFRVSIGYVFGTMRLSLIIYFFRARPFAAYTYLHAMSFLLHSTMGLVALIFGDGPWGHLRPNEFGLFEREHQLNPYAALPELLRRGHDHVEYWFWGMLQWLLQVFPRGTAVRGSLSLRLLPASAIMDSGLERIARFQHSLTSTFSPPVSPRDSASEPEGRRRNRSSSASSTLALLSRRGSASNWEATLPAARSPRRRPKRILCDPIELDGELVELHSPVAPGGGLGTETFDTDESSDSDSGSESDGESGIPSPPSSAFFPALRGSTGSGPGRSWSLVESGADAGSGEVILVGPAHFRLHVSQAKWNASILFWARPSLESYFSQRRIASWSALDAFVSRSDDLSGSDSDDSDEDLESYVRKHVDGIPVRGSVLLRGDGVLLSIATAPPQIRSIVDVVQRAATQPPESREAVVELIGRRVRCASGSKILYTFAEYRAFGMTLAVRQRATLLWLLNELNGADVALLRTYRQPHSFERGPALGPRPLP